MAHELMMITRIAWRWIIFVIGISVLLFGIALILLPGPAIVFIPLGLLILASEFVWARKIIKRIKRKEIK
ncbi:MAG: PGPGW domain-containing protein [Candidatus Woesearchaeota archaeon]